MGKESTEQAQILETTGKKEENMKQETRKTSEIGNPSNAEEYGIIKEKKLARDVKEQSTDNQQQQQPKVTMTKHNAQILLQHQNRKQKQDTKYHREDCAKQKTRPIKKK